MTSRDSVASKPTALAPETLPEGESIGGGRYALQRLYGRGGMAAVYEAVDRTSGKKVALKQLVRMANDAQHARHLELFEREYHTLAELAHPRVVQVHEFGREAGSAFYTMELLDGGDLQQLSPLPWRQVCAIARDVCSALSFLHSRRLVHRDVSPRNVRCTASGVAKLIDFGAVSPLGPNKLIVGTPPCCAPECVNLQSLDARTDLYALGASLYYALVGRHAFTAHSIGALPDAWLTGFIPPAQVVPEIPAALDSLVQDLLRLDPDARPASAWEVVQRLSAIDGVPLDSSLPLAHAYLTTPTLLDREESLEVIASRLRGLAAGRGSNVLITGAPGIGRSRLLDAALLQAALLGLTTARADADDATSEYAVVRALVRQLMRLEPTAALRAAETRAHLLRYAVPEIASANDQSLDEAIDVRVLRPRLQQALLEWFRAIASHRPLVVAIDDFDRIDEPSAALVAVLASEVEAQPISVLASASTEAHARSPGALELLRAASTTVPLAPLPLEKTEQLFSELFGEQPTLSLLAHRAHALANGNPRDLLRIAQQLLDRGVIHYEAGAFAVPPLDALELPTSMTAALEARIASLPPSALALGCGLALCADQSFGFAECVALAASTPLATRAELDVLIKAEIVRRVEDDHRLAQPALGLLLTAAVPSDTQRQLRVRLAGIFAGRADEFREAQQWFAAGEASRALDLLIAFVERDMGWLTKNPGQIRFNQLRSPPVGWRETYADALRACVELGRPHRDRLTLLTRLVGLGAMFGTYERECLRELLDQLVRDSALAEWNALGGELEAGPRLTAAFQNTQKRFDATPPHERGDDPIKSLRALANCLGTAMAVIPVAHDVAFLRDLPDLSPFAPLSPALDAFAQLRVGMLARLTGRTPDALRIYTALLDRIRRPDRSGVDPLNAEYIERGIINALGLLEAARGHSDCLKWASEIESHPAFEAHAVIIRRLHALFHADLETSDRLLARLQRLRIQGGTRQMLESSHILAETEAHARAEDLTRLRQVADEIARLAERYAGWRPVLAYARAEQHRIRKANAQALRAVRTGLRLVAAGEHQAWPRLACTHLLVLADLGQFRDAVAIGGRYLDEAQAQLGFQPAELKLAHALVLAQDGASNAGDIAQSTLLELARADVTGLPLGFAHEICARIALMREDVAAFEQHFYDCRAAYCAHRHPALVAKCERLRQQLAPRGDASDPASQPMDAPTLTRVGAALAACVEPERAQLALSFIARHSGVRDAFLFEIVHGALQCAAQIGDCVLTDELMHEAQSFLQAQLSADDVTTSESSALASPATSGAQTGQSGPTYTPLALSHAEADAIVITGVVMLGRPHALNLTRISVLVSELSRTRAQQGSQCLVVTP